MNTIENENYVLRDFSIFKWYSFIPGETSVDDIAVMKFHGRIEYNIPENFYSPTYNLHIVVSGSQRASINNQIWENGPNSGYFIAPGFLLQKTVQEPEYVEMYILAMSRKFAEELNMHVKLSQLAQIYAHPTWKMSEKKTRRVIEYIELIRGVIEDKNRSAVKLLALSLFNYLAGDFDGKELTSYQSALTREEEITGKFLALVDEHCDKEHGLDWYASELCLSTRYVANTVKQTLGMTASSCIENALTQRAKTLLKTTTLPIQDIADQLGFQNQSHFGTFFKRHAGLSPAAFRKQQ